jgi:predicted MFS family arabinose efflux permease
MCTGSSNFFSGVSGPMLIVLLARDLELPAGTIGLVFSFGAIGGLLGALTGTRVARWLGQGPTIWISVAVTAPFGLLIPLAQRGWMLWVAAFGFLMYWCGAVVYNITQVSFRQGLTPERLLGRMNATMRFLVWGTVPLGGFVGGVLGTAVGVRETLWIAAIGGMLGFLPVFFSPLRTMRQLPTGPSLPVPEEAGKMAP